jgi:protein ImuA
MSVSMSMAKADLLAELRGRIRRIEGIDGEGRVLPLGPAVDAALPGGLPLGCLHELTDGGDPGAAAATGFAATLLGRIAERYGPAVWIGRGLDLHAPGLAAYGLVPERLIVVRAVRSADVLWAMEEVLRCRGISAVLGEVRHLDPTAGRRLQLAAEAGGATGFVLRRPGPAGAVSAATRWVLAPAPSLPVPGEPGVGRPRWRVRLLRSRGGRPGEWLMEWRSDGLHAEPVDAGEPVRGEAGGGRPIPATSGTVRHGPGPQQAPDADERTADLTAARAGRVPAGRARRRA